MIVNQAALQSAYRGFKVIVAQALSAAQPDYSKVAMVIPSSAKSEDYGWLGNIPRMREWVGDRVIQNLTAHGFTIKNKDYELTIGVDRNDIEDDALGVYRPLFEMMGNSAAIHPDDLIFALLKAGFTTVCYDGQYFFDTDHPDGNGNVQSNKGTAALSVTSYGTARSTMMALKDDNGNSLKILPDLLVCGPTYDKTAREILFAEMISNNTNVYRNTAELLIRPELGNEWFLMDTKKPIKPMIFQQRKKPEFVALDNPNDENVFMKKKFVYGMDSRDNVGFALWQLCYGSTGAG